MKYFKLGMDKSKKNEVICHYDHDYGIEQNEFIIGKKCLDWKNCFQFFYNKSEGNILTDYLANDKGWFVVSEKLKGLLETMNTEIQFLPVEVFDRESSKRYTYFIANILRLVDALCLEKSDYFETEIPSIGMIYTVSKFAIFEDKIQKSDIFKLSNRQEVPVFVSENFKNIIEENKITGIALTEIRVV